MAFHMNLNGGYTLYIDGEEQNKGGSIGLPTKVYICFMQKPEKSYTIRLDYSVRYEGSLNFDLGKETINFSKEIER